jgi:hypothetical protein
VLWFDGMRILEGLLARFGYAKLKRFGLAMTPDGRIVTLQPSILDDGTGSRIVGWKAGDAEVIGMTPLSLQSPVADAAAAKPATFVAAFPVAPMPVAETPRVVAPAAPPVPVVAKPAPVVLAPAPAPWPYRTSSR